MVFVENLIREENLMTVIVGVVMFVLGCIFGEMCALKSVAREFDCMKDRINQLAQQLEDCNGKKHE